MSEVIVQPNPKLEEPLTAPSKRPLRSLIPILVITICLVAASAWFFFRMRRTAGNTTSREPAQVINAPHVRIKGTTEAVESRAILAPTLSGQTVSVLTITKLATSGARVKRGDVLVEFDRQAQIQNYIAKEVEYRKLAERLEEAEANERAARAKDVSELQLAENAWKRAQIEMQKLELLSRIDAEKAQQTLEETKATVEELRATFDLKRKAARAGIRILEIQRDRDQQAMKHAQENANLLRIVAPIDGVIVLMSIWKQGKMGEAQEGDQIRPGLPFMQVVDPSRMQIRALVNQEDFRTLEIGQTAQVHVDAYPDLVLPAKLEQISPVARRTGFSDRVRTFSATFSIQGSDIRLMPDLSAAIDVPGERQASSQ